MGAALQRKQEGEQFTVLDPANLPEKPSFPNRPLFAIGGLAGGLALGVGLTLFFEMQDTSIRTERDVEFALRLPVLAIVPAIEPASANKSTLRIRPTRPFAPGSRSEELARICIKNSSDFAKVLSM